MENYSLNPIQQSERIEIIDILRGWALLGVVIMNYMEFSKFNREWQVEPKTDLWGNFTNTTLDLFFESKSWTLLSVLFGYGFAMLIDNLRKKGYESTFFFARRMFWLLILAFVDTCFFFGDVLKDYAVIGLLLLLFRRMGAKALFITASAIILITPALIPLLRFFTLDVVASFNKILVLFHSKNIFAVFSFNLRGTYIRQMLNPFYSIICHLMILACMLLGVSAWRFGVFTRLAEYRKCIKPVFWYSLLFTVLTTILLRATFRFGWNYVDYYFPYFIPVIGMLLFIVSAICWLHLSGKLQRFFSSLGYMGKMTLTNYMVQNVVSMFVFSGAGFGVYNSWHPAIIVGFAVAVFVVQVLLSKWWLVRYNYGPIEWVWRQLSYQKRLEIKKPGKYVYTMGTPNR